MKNHLCPSSSEVVRFTMCVDVFPASDDIRPRPFRTQRENILLDNTKANNRPVGPLPQHANTNPIYKRLLFLFGELRKYVRVLFVNPVAIYNILLFV